MKNFTELCNNTIKDECKNPEYLLHGLVSEAGEVSGVHKKYIRGDFGVKEYEKRLNSEVGDCLWYIAMISKYLYLEDMFSEDLPVMPVTCESKGMEILKLTRLTGMITFEIQNTASHHSLYSYLIDIIGILGCITDLESAMKTVTDKLSKRKEAGTLQGDGEGDRTK